MKTMLVWMLLAACVAIRSSAADAGLRLSVYATGGDVLRYLGTEAEREKVLPALRKLRIDRVFLEGRRGDEYVPPAILVAARDFLRRQGIDSSGGIATVPGGNFGVRQDTALAWLNWESQKTRDDVAGFFREDAPLFPELIVDDFFCTADTSPASVQARGARPWANYRRDLLVSLAKSLTVQPAREQNPSVRMIIKYPQWYDRFHLFGYDPARMSPFFDEVWVGTEVRNPLTRRMGFVQPTEGYINFRWISAVAGTKTVGAWFDHIECTPQNFVDQAYQSVLAGARELTLFHLGDLAEGNPGDELLATRLDDLRRLATEVGARRAVGIAYYKPPASDAHDNLYLMDYLQFIGLPILPVAAFPEAAPVVFLGAQAAADADIGPKLIRHLQHGGVAAVTPAFLRLVKPEIAGLPGVRVGDRTLPFRAGALRMGRKEVGLTNAISIDAALSLGEARATVSAGPRESRIPWLTQRRYGQGQLVVLNVRTFDEQDFLDTGEWLLAPKPQGLSEVPQPVVDAVRRVLLRPLGLSLAAPAGVGYYAFGGAQCLYNFRAVPMHVALNGKDLYLGAHECIWVPSRKAQR